MNSLILDTIKTNSNWKSYLESLNINIKINEDNFAIFNYGIEADFTNPIVREARGIIIDIDELRVVSWPFTKFCNAHEPGAKIDLENFNWDNCRVEDKIDGSIVKLYYKPFRRLINGMDGEWTWATNSCIDAGEAPLCGSSSYDNFGQLIKSAINFADIPFDTLNKDYTYIFELISPDNQVVVKYPYTKLIHIGTRSNVAGEEYRVSIGIEQPGIYNIGHSLEDCIHAAEELNSNPNNVNKEGFVVVDINWHRIKVKSPDYLVAHKLWNNGNISKENALKWLQNHSSDDIDSDMTELRAIMKYYDYRMAELIYQVDQYVAYVRALYEELAHDRKAVALMIKNDKYAAFGFKAIGNTLTATELIKEISFSSIIKLIPNYVKVNIFARY